MYILGISCYYHEAAACLIKNGKIIAACAEERFSRIKHDSAFPSHAIDFCLKRKGILPKDLGYVVFYEKPFVKFERNLKNSLDYFPKSRELFVHSMKNFLTEKLWIKQKIFSELKIDIDRILFVPHHLSHAAASYYNSPFFTAAFFTLDAVGEWSTGSYGIASPEKIIPMAALYFPNSVGFLYSAFTAFLGYEVNEGEYKVMGLSGFGKPLHKQKIRKTFKQYKDGSIKLNLEYFSFPYSTNKMFSEKFAKEFSGLKFEDLASSLQEVTEEIVFNMLNFVHSRTGQTDLVYGGGVALNSVLNGKITSKTPFKRVFIFPAPGDDGGAIGCALYAYHQLSKDKKRYNLEDVFLGRDFKNAEIEKFLKSKKIIFRKLSNIKLASKVAQSLASRQVVGLFEGRAEFGPRALGHRSILADPRDAKMKEIVNSKIKFREQFRPFAPAVLEEQSGQYFKNIDLNLAGFMLGTFPAKPLARKQAPAIVHVDGSSRVQIVNKKFKGNLRKILENFFKLTGVPILLNTSFNLKGEPIVDSLDDAYKTFQASDLDLLVLGNCVIEKDR